MCRPTSLHLWGTLDACLCAPCCVQCPHCLAVEIKGTLLEMFHLMFEQPSGFRFAFLTPPSLGAGGGAPPLRRQAARNPGGMAQLPRGRWCRLAWGLGSAAFQPCVPRKCPLSLTISGLR